MDDMVYQCNNRNSIYVLNASYNAYGEFGTYGHLDSVPNKREINCNKMAAMPATTTTATRNAIEASCLGMACNLQHKLKTFGTATVITTGATTPAAAAATTTAIANPNATSMSTTMCSPTTTALQKLFNCGSANSCGNGDGGGVGVGATSGGICQNVSHRNHNNNNNKLNNSSSQCLTGAAAVAVAHRSSVAAAAAAAVVAAATASNNIMDLPDTAAAAGALLGYVGVGGASRKKCTNVKSTLIAKKTKFLKFLEEEKWRGTAMEETTSSSSSSNEADRHGTGAGVASATASSFAAHSGVAATRNNNNNNNSNNLKNRNDNNHEAGTLGQQNKLNNWSMNNGDNNKQQEQQQQQQQYKQLAATTTKSSYELYKEAADILGLSCTLCDNCRCLDCQSGYFDCDDDDSYSEHSFMDEYDEYDYEYAAGQMTDMANQHVAIKAAMVEQPQQQQQQQEEEEECSSMCYVINCQHECNMDAKRDNIMPTDGNGNEEQQPQEMCSIASTAAKHDIAIDFDLINATSSQVLKNCKTFNELSLLDAEQRTRQQQQRQVEPLT